MLTILPKREMDFIQFLNDNYPCEDEIRLTILQGYDAVTDDETGGKGFAVFLPQENIIMLPTDIPEDILSDIIDEDDMEFVKDFTIHNLAHEYAHALQFNGVRHCTEEELEDDADAFANEAVEKFNAQYSSNK